MAHDPNSQPSRDRLSASTDPDRALKGLLGVVALGVAINLLSSAIETQPWVWIPPMLFVLAVVTVIPRTGLLRREPHIGTRWTRGLALASLLVYLGIAIWGAATAWPLLVMIFSSACLWATCVLVTWPALRSQQDLDVVALGVAALLVGVAGILVGVAALRDGNTLLGGAVLLTGIAMLLYGVAALRDSDTLLGGAVLLGVVAMLLVGVGALRGGETLLGGAVLAVVAMLLAGVAILRAGETLFGIAMLVGGLAWLLGGVAALRSPNRSGRPAALTRRLKDWLTQR